MSIVESGTVRLGERKAAAAAGGPAAGPAHAAPAHASPAERAIPAEGERAAHERRCERPLARGEEPSGPRGASPTAGGRPGTASKPRPRERTVIDEESAEAILEALSDLGPAGGDRA